MIDGRILIVEDDKDIREVYKLVLTHNGYPVCTANNGQEALAELDSCKPRLVLLDIFMPVMDGEAFLRSIDLRKYPDTTIIVCSNTADQKLLETMLSLGAERVVTKASLGPADLAAMVEPYMIS